MKVMIVDDDPTTRQFLQTLVSRAGHEVLLASDGVEAIELAAHDRPDIVLADWMMPRVTGVELCAHFRSAGPGQPYIFIILLTARDNAEDIVEGLDAGADDYIVKPFNAAELLARIRTGERIIRLETVLRSRNEELEQSLQTIRRLKGLLPLCMFCKRVRNDHDYWQQLETYIHEQTGTDFSHGVCPECMKKHYPDSYRALQEERQKKREPPLGGPKK
ncbi:MAG: response regulator transcription factor [Candidatus Sumerlaeia bacterium]|nr:response regulator transcription factor [Candidatus Sumerlaeia bacterium]